MDRLKNIVPIAGHNFRKWATNPRIYLILLLLLGYGNAILSSIGTFCRESGYPVTPWVFPFFTAEPYSLLMLMLGVILLFCDAPFMESEQPYLVLRAGRMVWALGQILYIVAASALYFLTTLVSTIVLLLPHLSLDGGWGKVIQTLCKTGMGKQSGVVIPFDPTIPSVFSPYQAMLAAFLLAWLVGTLLGLLLFFVNLQVSRSAGVLCCVLLAVFPLFVRRSDTFLHYFSPVSWVSLSVVDFTGTTFFPSIQYVLIALLGLIVLLSVSVVLSLRRRDIDVLKSV